MKKLISLLVSAALVFSLCMGVSAAGKIPAELSEICTQKEWEVLKLTNQERLANGLTPYSVFPSLQNAAGVREQELVSLFSHNRPDGSQCFTVLTEGGLGYSSAAENIAAGQSSPRAAVQFWLDSEDHQDNIMSSSFMHMGMGYTDKSCTIITQTGTGRIRNGWVQLFLNNNCTITAISLSEQEVSCTVGTSLNSLNLYVKATCSVHGTCYLPVLSGMCTGYSPETEGTQTVTVTYAGRSAQLQVNVLSDWNNDGDTGSSPGSPGNTPSLGGGSSSGGDSNKDTTTTDSNGNKTTVTSNSDGTKNTKIELSNTTVSSALTNDSVVALPMETVTVSKDTAQGGNTITVTTNTNVPIKVEIPVTNTTPGTVAVIIKQDGTEQIIRDSILTDKGVVTTVSNGDKIAIKDNTKTFHDVTADKWFNNAVTFVAARGLFAGVGNNNFAPDQTTNRGMIVQVLHNLEYNKAHTKNHSFHDVGDHHWYDNAVSWAAENKVVGGYGDGSFQGEKEVTREELVVMLWNYAGKQPSTNNDRAASFNDAENISDWALEAMNWALENGILGGKGGNTLDPVGKATRAELAQMMKNFCEHK